MSQGMVRALVLGWFGRGGNIHLRRNTGINMELTPDPSHVNSHGPILIVDDDPDFRSAMAELFEVSGHPVATARDGNQALTQLRTGLVPCVIVLDLSMPRLDGFGFRREQLADSALASIPVIVHSSHGDLAAVARRLQAAAYVRKTDTLDTLLQVVTVHCRQRDNVAVSR